MIPVTQTIADLLIQRLADLSARIIPPSRFWS